MKSFLNGIVASFLVAQPVLGAQTPAIEAVSLMDLRFYEKRGAFLADDLQLVFPPGAGGALRFVIKTSSGEEVASTGLQTEKIGFEAFAKLRPQGPGVLEVGKAGTFVMSAELDGQTIASLPFSMKVDGGDDPFNPARLYTREGPWSQLAYIAQKTRRPDDALEANWWTRAGDMPGEKGPKCSVEIVRAGRVVARSRSDVVVRSPNWQHFRRELVQPDGKTNFTMATLAQGNGPHEMVAKCAGKVVRRYSFEIAGGEIVAIPRARLDHQPHQEFLSPRRIDTSSGTGSRYEMQNVFWATAE